MGFLIFDHLSSYVEMMARQDQDRQKHMLHDRSQPTIYGTLTCIKKQNVRKNGDFCDVIGEVSGLSPHL